VSFISTAHDAGILERAAAALVDAAKAASAR
jgi:hypothetical protein